MKKSKELLWFLLPFFGLLLLESPFLLEDALFNETEIGRVILFLVNRFVELLLGAVIQGFVIGGLLLLVHRRISFTRRRFYVLLFVASALCVLVFQMVQVPFVIVYPRTWIAALRAGNAAAFFVWLVELIWTAVKKPKQEVETE